MYIQHNDFRIARKRSHLTQSDFAFILNLYDHNTVSNWERGANRPLLESLLSYHLIFDLPIDDFFQEQKKIIAETLRNRIPLRIQQLKSEKSDFKQNLRIEFLEAVLSKLTAQANV